MHTLGFVNKHNLLAELNGRPQLELVVRRAERKGEGSVEREQENKAQAQRISAPVALNPLCSPVHTGETSPPY